MSNLGQIQEKLYTALYEFYDNHGRLLEIDANERSITHWLAACVQDQFPDWVVDCEYNRKGRLPKKLRQCDERVPIHNTNGRTVYPDIIVHHREQPMNLLIAEIKKASSDEGPEKDLEKLVEFGSHSDYQYEFGVFGVLGTQHVFLQWFVKGAPIEFARLTLDHGEFMTVADPPDTRFASMFENVCNHLERVNFDV